MYTYLGEGSPVMITGVGLGFITKITRAKRPYHVTAMDTGKEYIAAREHLTYPEDETDRIRARDAYANWLKHRTEAERRFVLGTVCMISKRTGYFVVISVPRDGKLKAAQLGGDNNRYISASVDLVTPVGPVSVYADEVL